HSLSSVDEQEFCVRGRDLGVPSARHRHCTKGVAMKRLITIVGVGAALALGGGTVAASTPPTAGALILTPSTAAAGTSFDVTLVGCAVGETVTFEIEGTD